tara:strand:+ start:266 stop:559 length:294 start_codon:yes stop_codon:yes gene_type:complete
MNTENLIPVDELCIHYQVTDHFFDSLEVNGLVEIQIVKKVAYVRQNTVHHIEKIIRIHQELEINLEGVAVVLNLLEKIDTVQNELTAAKNRLLLYEK